MLITNAPGFSLSSTSALTRVPDWIARAGIVAGLCLMVYASAVILKHRGDETLPDTTLRVLPCFHVAMVFYAAGIALGAFHALL